MTASGLPVIGDLLATNRHLEIYCYAPGCRREARLSATEAVRLLGPETPFVGLKKRLRCSRCGQRGRHGYIDVRPCTLDLSAWELRQKYRGSDATPEPAPGYLDTELARLQRLLGDRGELGGDGPVGG
jgi:hypothetical protein